MKKLFLIPLLACFTCVMAWAADIKVGGEGEDYPATIAGLNAAIAAAGAEDVVLLGADIAYAPNGSGLIDITKSVTIDGQNHTISGYGKRGSNNTTIALNAGSTANKVAVTLKDLTIRNAGSSGRPIETRGNIESLTLNNVKLYATGAPNCQGITIGGNQATAMTLNMTNSLIDVTQRNQAGEITKSGSYAIISFNPYHATIDHCTFYAWAGLYFREPSSSQGSRGSVVNVENTAFHCSNYNSGSTNSFGGFVCQDDGITINATNCTIESSALGNQAQAVLLASGDYIPSDRRTQPISLTLAGDNTRIIMDGAYYGNIDVKAVKTFENNTWYKGSIWWGSDDYIVPFSVTITGGTYDVNPYYYRHVTAVNRDGEGNPIQTEDGYSVVAQSPVIPAGYAVIEVKDGDKTLYRVTKDNVSYDINGQYETSEAGDNPTTSFVVETTNDQPIELVNNETEAAYVQVRDNGDGDATVLKVGKVENAGTPSEAKVDQTLIVNNGLDVQGESQVVVQPGSTLQIGEGGIVTEKPENIVIEANENGAASLLMDPAITVNQTPLLTVKMKAKSIGWMDFGEKSYFWHRFALPIQECTTWVKTPNKSTYVFGWNYSANNWEQLSALTQMVPFKGYTLTADYENLGDVEYTFTGRLAGNVNNALNFERNGFNFFGNSYTGYIDVLALLDQLMGDAKIDGSVWMWGEDQQYHVVPLQALRDDPTGFDSWQKEVAPMQTFILKQNGSENATAELNYASAVWGNPRYGNAAPAPRRAEADEITRMRIIVTAENGKSDFVMFTKKDQFSDAYEKGYDGEKYMNENALNMYATIEGANYSAVATDNLAGKMMTINTVEAVNYTMSFAKVNGEEYAIRDNVTGAIIAIANGATYEFAAQPNSIVEGRFEIIPLAEVPTAIENTEVKANVKGIYTIMGQYLGEDFDILPAGIYVVNGVKIVK